MSNIAFLENLVKRFQPGLLGQEPDSNSTLPVIRPLDQPVPYVGDVPVIDPPNKYSGLVSAINQLPAITPAQPQQAQPLPAIVPAAAPAPVAEATIRPRIADEPPSPVAHSLPSILTPTNSPAEQRLSEIDSKNYEAGVYRNPETGETTHNPNKPGYTEVVSPPGAARKKNWSTWNKIGSFLDAWAKGGLLPGIQAATNRNYFPEQQDARDRAQLLPIISNERQGRMQALQIQNTLEDNARAKQQANDLAQYRTDTIQERENNRKSRDMNVKMRTVSSMLSHIPNYDPNDPRFADVTKALGDVGLPLAPKDAKKQVKLVQDADTGAWTLSLTDPFSGQQEVRPVMDKDGKQLVTTSTARVAADAAAGRQVSQQKYDSNKQQIAAQLSKEIEDHKAALREINAEKDQQRKLQLIKANEERQRNIATLQQNLKNALDSENQ